MAPGWKTRWGAAGAVALLLGVAGCRDKSAPPAAPPAPPPAQAAAPAAPAVPKGPWPPAATPPPQPVAFAAAPARLAVVPSGHEPGEAVFSADGRHVAYVTTKEDRAWAWLDGKQGPAFDAVRGLALRPGSATLAYVGRRGNTERAVVDGREGPPFAALGELRFAADGRVVHSARQGTAWLVVSGGRERQVVATDDPAPLLSPDGRRIFFVEQAAAPLAASLRACSLDLAECAAGAPAESIGPISPDAWGVRLAYVATRDGKEAVSLVELDRPGVSERPLGAWDSVAMLGLSEGGRHVAILARRGEQRLLVRDGEEQPAPEFDTPIRVVVASSGRVLVVAVKDGKAVALVDGQQAGAGVEEVTFPVFSADGSGLAYVAGVAARSVLVVDGSQAPTLDKVVTPRFLPGAGGVVYRARQRGERFVVQADAKGRTVREHPHHQGVYEVSISPDGKAVGYGTRDGQELWWRVEPVVAAGAR